MTFYHLQQNGYKRTICWVKQAGHRQASPCFHDMWELKLYIWNACVPVLLQIFCQTFIPLLNYRFRVPHYYSLNDVWFSWNLLYMDESHFSHLIICIYIYIFFCCISAKFRVFWPFYLLNSSFTTALSPWVQCKLKTCDLRSE